MRALLILVVTIYTIPASADATINSLLDAFFPQHRKASSSRFRNIVLSPYGGTVALPVAPSGVLVPVATIPNFVYRPSFSIQQIPVNVQPHIPSQQAPPLLVQSPAPRPPSLVQSPPPRPPPPRPPPYVKPPPLSGITAVEQPLLEEICQTILDLCFIPLIRFISPIFFPLGKGLSLLHNYLSQSLYIFVETVRRLWISIITKIKFIFLGANANTILRPINNVIKVLRSPIDAFVSTGKNLIRFGIRAIQKTFGLPKYVQEVNPVNVVGGLSN